MEQYYSLSPDIAIVRLKEGGVLFKSDTLGIKLEGESAIFLIEQVFPLLTGENELGYVASQFNHITKEDLHANLDQLVHAGVLQCRDEKKPGSAGTGGTGGTTGTGIPSFFMNFLHTMERDEKITLQELARFRVAVIGLDAHGTQTILSLLQVGMRNFLLLDPFPCNSSYIDSFPFLQPYADEGGSKQDCLKRYLEAQGSGMQVSTGPSTLTKETLEQCMADCQLCIVCMDKGFSAVFYWVNQISVSRGVPVLYSAVRGHLCFAGPFVIPDKTSCYMCYKMRQVAALDNFDEGMSYEEYLNDQKRPAFGDRNIFPAGIQFLAGILSSEATKYALSLSPPSLPDRVMEFNALTFQNTTHVLLQKPDCPVCQKKKTDRPSLAADELIRLHSPSRLSEVLDTIVSPHTGILKSLERMPKDITEPTLPYVFVANLANHSFLPKDKYELLRCSGKGMDLKSARISAAGEAVERYSGTVYPPDEIIYRSYAELDGMALDPQRLVLYLPDQYESIPYMPFSASESRGWISAYSLVHDKPIYVPAHGTIMNYTMRSQREYICQSTSNGLAAGGSLLSAVLSASLEVIERDAFIITWHNQLPAKRISMAAHPSAEMREFETAYKRRGVELQLYLLPTDAPVSVFMCVSVQEKGEGPRVVVGLGCDFSAAKAARQALLEVGQVRPACRQRLRLPKTRERLAELIANPECVEELEDHDLLYATSDHLHAFDFLFQQPLSDFDWGQDDGDREPGKNDRDAGRSKSPAEQLRSLIGHFRQKGSDLIYCNLTPPDMEKIGLFTARAIIPDYQPIHFGWKHIRMGGDRLFELPVQLGFRETRVPVTGLNKFPHPLA
ncbi:MAG TPA: TOMM precursor leader peptide-binding protein [Puia sp.]|nr:TOMM precursor leader peptide-binding protein [Puia sp.]